MKIPYLINLILLFLFSTSCVHLQFLVGDNPDGEKKNEIKELEITKEKENSFNVSSKLLEEKDLVINELTFEVKKLRAELNNSVSEIKELKKVTADLSDPFKSFNKEILLNNGSTIQGKILYQDDQMLKVATIIGTLTVDRNTIIRVVEKSNLVPTTLEEAVANSKYVDPSLGETGDGFIGILGVQSAKSSPITNSANLVLVGNIDEVKAKAEKIKSEK